ncbi:MAG: DUF4383 domain-containing protein [Actinomycetota bacterium]|nr:DUF4383 domain-containing protein [Actinomycetota bacterium]
MSMPRLYLLGAGLLLLGQGGAGLFVRATGRDPHATTHLLSDPAHSTIHLVWGLVMLAVLVRRDERVAERTTLAFGIFYVGLLAAGLFVHHPFGLMIDGGENAFHAVVGPLALLVWLRAVLHRRASTRSEKPVEVR